jgi:asparagine synthase (glutamine-hydrolysing)
MSGLLDERLRKELFRGELAALDGRAGERAVRALVNGAPDDPLPTTLYLDARLALVDDMLHYFDRASMAHSLEVRVPFLDHHLVEYCAQIPGNLKVRRLTTKHLLKHAARQLLPSQIVDRPKIGFFNATLGGWFRGQARGAMADYLLAPQPRYAELLERGAVERLMRRQANGEDPHSGRLLLSILMLEVWLSTYLPRALRQPSPRAPAAVAP